MTTTRHSRTALLTRVPFLLCALLIWAEARGQESFGAAFGVASGATGYASPTVTPPGLSEPTSAEQTDPGAAKSSGAGSTTVSKFGVGGKSRARGTGRSPTWQLWWGMNGENWLRSRHLIRSHGLSLRADADLRVLARSEPIGRSRAHREIVPALRHALKEDAPALRASAAIALGRICDARDGDIVNSIRALLSDPQLDVRASAILALGFLGSETTIPELSAIVADAPLARSLAHSSGHIAVQLRAVACVALGMVCARTQSPLSTSAASHLLRLAAGNEASIELRGAAVLSLALFRPAHALPRLTALAMDAAQDQSVRAHAISTLGRLNDAAAVPPLIALLEERSALISAAAATALGFLCGPDHITALKALRGVATGAPDRALLGAAILALGECGGTEERKFLQELLTQDAPFVSAQAALGLAISCARTPDADSSRFIQEAWLRCSNLQEKGAFGIAMAIARTEGAEALLSRALADKSVDRELAFHLSAALGSFPTASAAAVLHPWITQDRDPLMRVRAAQGAFMLHSEDAVPLLVQALPASRASQGQLIATAQALGLSSDARALAPLLATAADLTIPDLSRASALAALGILAEKDAESALQALRRGANYAAANGALAALLRVQ